MKSVKWYMSEGIELPNQEKMRTQGEKETYKYLEVLEAHTIKKVKMKEKIEIEYRRRTRKLLETKENSWLGHYLSGQENKITRKQKNWRRCIRPYIPEMTLTDYMC